jgi:hypothetical protein
MARSRNRLHASSGKLDTGKPLTAGIDNDSTPVEPNQTHAIRHVEDALTRAQKAIMQDASDGPERQYWTVYVDLEDRGS